MLSAAPLTPHRMLRLLQWSRVWLAMALALPDENLLPAWAAARLHLYVRSVRAVCLRLLIALAGQAIVPAQRPRFAVAHARFFRRAIGTRLRRSLRGRTLRARIEALVHVLQNLRAVVIHLARRLKRGLHEPRVFALVRAIFMAPAAPFFCTSALRADSS